MIGCVNRMQSNQRMGMYNYIYMNWWMIINSEKGIIILKLMKIRKSFVETYTNSILYYNLIYE